MKFVIEVDKVIYTIVLGMIFLHQYIRFKLSIGWSVIDEMTSETISSSTKFRRKCPSFTILGSIRETLVPFEELYRRAFV